LMVAVRWVSVFIVFMPIVAKPAAPTGPPRPTPSVKMKQFFWTKGS
jgi:hypothetical protein